MITQNHNRNPLMNDEDQELENGWKTRSETLQSQVDVLTKALDDEKKKTQEKESTAKIMCDAAIAMVQKAQEMFGHKDFKTTFAIAEMQGFKYQGPIIQEAAKELVVSIQSFQTSWK